RSGNFEPFEVAVLRHISSGLGITYEQLTSDFSRTNYSSFRGATNEVLKTFNRRSKNFESGFAFPIRAAVVEEIMDVEDLPLPAGAPPFEEFRTAYARCRWLRPGRGWVDPVAEKQGAILGMEAGLSTLEIEAAENVGEDWEEIVDARAIELKRFKELGLTPPRWAEVMPMQQGQKPDTPPEKP
ncbi:phage portal protein, partial [Thioclava sp. BHET1]